jgi:hypothetical protein
MHYLVQRAHKLYENVMAHLRKHYGFEKPTILNYTWRWVQEILTSLWVILMLPYVPFSIPLS